MRPQAEQKGLRFIVENRCCQGLALVTDRLRLEQVLINIIGNAVKFTGEGGDVIFSITPEEGSSGGQRLTFSVKDTGIGIASEAMDSKIRENRAGASYFQPPGPDAGRHAGSTKRPGRGIGVLFYPDSAHWKAGRAEAPQQRAGAP